MQLTVEVNGGTATVRLSGRFDSQAHNAMREAISPLLRDATMRELVVDMKQLEYIDSMALSRLLQIRESANTAGKSLVLANPSGLVRKALEIANFHKIFTLR